MTAPLSEKTQITLWAAVLAIGGGAFWISGLSRDVSAQDKRIEAVELRADKLDDRFRKDIIGIKEDLGVIRGRLGIPRKGD